MTLDQNDAELFYELWFPLLDYAKKNTWSAPILKKYMAPRKWIRVR